MTYPSIAKQVKALRKHSTLTQAQFARLIGVATLTISRWEKGSVKPHANKLASLIELAVELGTAMEPFDKHTIPGHSVWDKGIDSTGQNVKILIGAVIHSVPIARVADTRIFGATNTGRAIVCAAMQVWI